MLELLAEAGEETDTAAAGDTLLTGKDDASAGDDKTTDTPGEAAKSSEGETSEDDKSKDDETAGEKSDKTPTDYSDFELPEGIQVDTEFLDKAKPVMQELGLTQEQAQKLVSVYADQIQEVTQGQVESFNQLTQDWLNQAKNDKEIGGDKFDEHTQDARAAINKFGTPELKQLLDETGVGNHPEIVRVMARVGKLLREDSPGDGGNPVTKDDDPVSILYPSDSE